MKSVLHWITGPRRMLMVIPLAAAMASLVMTLGPYPELTTMARPSGGIIDETPRWTMSQLTTHLEAVGATGRRAYTHHLWWDLVFITANVLALTSWLSTLTDKSHTRLRFLIWVPVTAGALDLGENLLTYLILHFGPGELSASSLAVVTTLKMGSFGAALVAALALTVGWLASKLRPSRHSRVLVRH